jgi:hypothetical protein
MATAPALQREGRQSSKHNLNGGHTCSSAYALASALVRRDVPRTEFKLSALPQVSGTLSHNLSGQDVFVIALLALPSSQRSFLPPSGLATRTGGRTHATCSKGSSAGTGSPAHAVTMPRRLSQAGGACQSESGTGSAHESSAGRARAAGQPDLPAARQLSGGIC